MANIDDIVARLPQVPDYSGALANVAPPLGGGDADQQQAPAPVNPLSPSGVFADIPDLSAEMARPSALGVFGRSVERGVAPALATMAGSGAGMAGGAFVGGPPGAFVGGLGLGVGSGLYAAKLQSDFLQAHPELAKFLGQDPETQQADIAAHPLAALGGEATTMLATGRPSLSGGAAKILKGAATGAAVGGAVNTGQNLVLGNPALEGLPQSLAFGALFNKPWLAGGVAERLGAKAVGALGVPVRPGNPLYVEPKPPPPPPGGGAGTQPPPPPPPPGGGGGGGDLTLSGVSPDLTAPLNLHPIDPTHPDISNGAPPPTLSSTDMLSPFVRPGSNAMPGAPSSIERVDPYFAQRIAAAIQMMPPNIAAKFAIDSGFRDQHREDQVYAEQHPGQPVPQNSQHGKGLAIDIVRDPDVQAWLNAHQSETGIGFPLQHLAGEDNHLEPLDANGNRYGAHTIPQSQGGPAPDPGTTPTAPEAMPGERFGQAVDFFVAKGLTRDQAIGVVSRLHAESGLDPNNTNSIGATGIAQWYDRRPAMEAAGAKGDFQKQLEYIWQEFNGSEADAFSRIKNAQTAADAARAMEFYERAGNPKFTESAAQLAARISGGDAGFPAALHGSTVPSSAEAALRSAAVGGGADGLEAGMATTGDVLGGGAAAPTTTGQPPATPVAAAADTPLSRAIEALNTIQPGVPMTHTRLRQIGGVDTRGDVEDLRAALVQRGLITLQNGRYIRADTINQAPAMAPTDHQAAELPQEVKPVAPVTEAPPLTMPGGGPPLDHLPVLADEQANLPPGYQIGHEPGAGYHLTDPTGTRLLENEDHPLGIADAAHMHNDAVNAEAAKLPTPPLPEAPAAPATDGLGILTGFGNMAKGMMHGLYQGFYDELAGTATSRAFRNDPEIPKLRPFFDSGFIKSPEDIRALIANKYDPEAAGLSAPEAAPVPAAAEAAQLPEGYRLQPTENGRLQLLRPDGSWIAEGGSDPQSIARFVDHATRDAALPQRQPSAETPRATAEQPPETAAEPRATAEQPAAAVAHPDLAEEQSGLPPGYAIEHNQEAGTYHLRDPNGQELEALSEPGGMADVARMHADAMGDSRFDRPLPVNEEGLTPEHVALRGELYRLLKQIAPSLRLKTAKDLMASGEPIHGRFDPAGTHKNFLEHLAQVALSGPDPIAALHHEIVHFFRAAGMFTKGEWAALTKHADQWREKYHIDERYPGETLGYRREEAIADAAGRWRRGEEQVPPGIRRVFQKMQDFLERVGNFLKGRGYQSASDVFAKMHSGEIGRRAEGSGLPPEVEGTRFAITPTDEPELDRVLPEKDRRVGQFVMGRGTVPTDTATWSARDLAAGGEGKRGIDQNYVTKSFRNAVRFVVTSAKPEERAEVRAQVKAFLESDAGKNFFPKDINFWDDALKLPDRARFWYEISAEAFKHAARSFSPAEMASRLKQFFDVVAATSAQANPFDNLRRTLGIMAEHRQGIPVKTDVTDTTAVRNALGPNDLSGNKTGAFSRTFSHLLGIVRKTPLSVNDRQVASTFGISGEDISNNQWLHKALSKFYQDMRDKLNQNLKPGENPYETWQLQALAWVHERAQSNAAKGKVENYDDYDLVMKRLDRILTDAGVDTSQGLLSDKVLMDPRVPNILSGTREQFVGARQATLEATTALTPEGIAAKAMLPRLAAINAPWARQFEQAYVDIQRRAMNAIATRVGGGQSAIEKLFSAVSGRKIGVTRIDTEGYGTFEGELSPNMRIPMAGRYTPRKGETGLFDFEDPSMQPAREAVLAAFGKYGDQAASAASKFDVVPHGDPNARTQILFIPGTTKGEHVDAIERFGHDVGVPLNVHETPNGTVVELNIGGFEDNAPTTAQVQAAADRHFPNTENGIVASDYKSDYLTHSDYDEKIRAFWDQANANPPNVAERVGRSGTAAPKRELWDEAVQTLTAASRRRDSDNESWERRAGKRIDKHERDNAAASAAAGSAESADALRSGGTRFSRPDLTPEERRSPRRVASEFGGHVSDEFKNYGRTIEDVPISWLKKLGGNALRQSLDEVHSLGKDIRDNGLKSPLIINVGKDSRTAQLGEGNHRLRAMEMMGFTHAPARVVVGNEWGKSRPQPSGMDADIIPKPGEYFKGDASPSDVFRSLAPDTGTRFSRPLRGIESDQEYADYARLVNQGDQRTIKQKGLDLWTGLKQNFGTRFKQGAIDRQAGRALFERELNGGQLLDHRTSPTEEARRAAYTGDIVQSVMGLPRHDGTFAGGMVRFSPTKGTFEKIPGSQALLESARPIWQKGLQVKTGLYLLARRSQDLMQQGRENLVKRGDLQYLNLAQQHPEIAQFAREYDKFQNQLMDFAEWGGTLDKATRAKFGRNYVPYYRIDENGDPVQSSASGAGQHIRSGIQKLTGGEAQINDLWDNIFHNANMIMARAIRNHAEASIFDIGNGVGGVTPMSAAARAELRTPAKQAQLRALGQDPVAVANRADQLAKHLYGMQQKNDPKLVSFMKDGKPTYYYVENPLLLRSIRAFGPMAVHPVIKALGIPSRLLTKGVTSMPDFMLRNLTRDTTSAQGIIPELKFPGQGTFKGLVDAYRNSDALLEMMAAGGGGGHGMYYHQNISPFRKQLQERLPKSLRDRILHTPKQLIDAYEHIGKSGEQANRLAIFQAIKKSGNVARAAAEARDILPFAQHGDSQLMQTLITLVPFLNARVQGLNRMYRGFKETPATLALRGGLLTAATAALWYMNKDDERYKQMPDYARQNYYHLMGKDFHYMLPMPFEHGAIFSTIPEVMLNYLNNGSSKEALGAAMAMIKNQLNFDPVPQAVHPLLDLYANKNSFTGAPIVTPGEEKLESGLQVSPQTSRVIAAAGGALNISPAQLDYAIKAYGGGLGIYALAAADALGEQAGLLGPTPSTRLDRLPIVSSFYRQEPEGANRDINDFYDLSTSIKQLHDSINLLGQQGRGEEAAALAMRNPMDTGLYPSVTAMDQSLAGLRKSVTAINAAVANRQMTPEAGRETIDQLTAARNQIGAQGARQLNRLHEGYPP